MTVIAPGHDLDNSKKRKIARPGAILLTERGIGSDQNESVRFELVRPGPRSLGQLGSVMLTTGFLLLSVRSQ